MQLTLRMRLWLGFGTMAAVMTIIGVMAISYASLNQKIAHDRLPVVASASDGAMESRINYLHLIYGTMLAVSPAHEGSREQSKWFREDAKTGFVETLNELRESGEISDATISRVNNIFTSMVTQSDEVVRLVGKEGANSESCREALKEFIALSKKIHEEMEVIEEGDGTFAGTDATVVNLILEVEEIAATKRVQLLVFLLIGVSLGLTAMVFTIRGVTRPVKKFVVAAEQMNREFSDFEKVLRAISENDLTQKVPEHKTESLGITSKDEFGALAKTIEQTLEMKTNMGHTLTTMSGNLTNIIRQMADNSRELVSAATEIASSAEQLSRGAQTQSTQVNQVAAAVQQMTANIVESSRNTGDAAETSKSASAQATNGGQIVSESINGMQKIANVVRESSESIAKLSKSADQIGEIISVIDDIADQTNLLALNAAIEAARAGEQGRGFAVVADEVRKLAERTGKATGEITQMIRGIQTETGEAVQSMEAGILQVDRGRELTDKAGASLNEIVTMSGRVLEMIQQIAAAAEEQSAAAEEISKSIEGITSVTQETAKGAEQSAAAAEELNRQADGLQQMVARFKVRA